MATGVESSNNNNNNKNNNNMDDALKTKANNVVDVTVPTLQLNLESSNSSSLLSVSQRPRSGSEPRRIIKAAKLKESDNNHINNDNDHENDNEDNVTRKKKKSSSGSSSNTSRTEHVPVPIAESPSVAREQVQETYEHFKEDRRHTVAERQKATREHKRKERRTSSTTTTTATTATAAVSANPMSRFLSIFSVEPLYPWHKRSYEKAKEDLMDEPSEKRLRSSEDDAQDEGDTKDATTTTTTTTKEGQERAVAAEPAQPPSSSPQAGWTSTHLLTAVTVVAVTVLVVWRWSSRRR